MAGMKNKILTGIAAFGMATAPLTKGQAAESMDIKNIAMDTSKDLITIVDLGSQGENGGDKSISYDESQKDLERKQEIRAILAKEMNTGGWEGVAHEIKDLEEKYGKNFVIEQVNTFVKVIEGDLDKFGSFDAKGNYSLDEEKVSELVRDTYFGKEKIEKTLAAVSLIIMWILSAFGVINGLSKKEINN